MKAFENYEDLCFNPCFNGSIFKGDTSSVEPPKLSSFNPCFNGSIFKGEIIVFYEKPEKCFNPCFNGSIFKGYTHDT